MERGKSERHCIDLARPRRRGKEEKTAIKKGTIPKNRNQAKVNAAEFNSNKGLCGTGRRKKTRGGKK